MEQTDKCVLDAPIGEEIQQAFEELHKKEEYPNGKNKSQQ